VRPNKALEPTPLRGNEIVAILKRGFSSTPLQVYQGDAAKRPPVGRQAVIVFSVSTYLDTPYLHKR
jgi:hypothetical protein